MPYSRATIELWLSGPPTSVTTALAIANSVVQAGVVMLATSTSPGCNRAKSAGPASTRAVPVTCPALAPIPRSTGPGLLPRRGREPAGERLLPPAALREHLRRCHQPLPPPHAPAAAPRPPADGHGGRRLREDLRAVQPEHVVRPLDHTGRDQPRAQLAQHPAQLRPGQADVGQGVFAQRRDRLRPAQEPQEHARGAPGRAGRPPAQSPRRGAAPRAAAARGARSPRRRGRTAPCRSPEPDRPPAPGPRSRGCRRCARAGPGAARTGRTTPAT